MTSAHPALDWGTWPLWIESREKGEMDSLIHQLNWLIEGPPQATAEGETSLGQTMGQTHGQTLISCPRDLLITAVKALSSRTAQENEGIVKPSAWATRERALLSTIEKQKSEIGELYAKNIRGESAVSFIPSGQNTEGDRIVKKLTRERDELRAKVQQLTLACNSRHSPTTHSAPSPSVNAAAADQAAQSSGLVVVEHLSVSRSRLILQQRVDENKEREKAIRMSGGGSRNAQIRAYTQKEAGDVPSPPPAAEFSPEGSPDGSHEAYEEKVEAAADENSPIPAVQPLDQIREESCSNEEEEGGDVEEMEESALEAAMRALVAAAADQQKMMEEEEEHERQREAEKAQQKSLMEEKQMEDTDNTCSTSSAPPFTLDGEKEIDDLKQMVKGLDAKIKVYEATLQSMRATVEEADDERQLLREQTMHLASTLAEMQAFISHRAKDKKSSSISFGSWLKKREQLPVSSLPDSNEHSSAASVGGKLLTRSS